MKNGVPETYHELTAMKKSVDLSKYISGLDVELIRQAFVFMMQNAQNKIFVSQTFMEWVDYTGRRAFILPIEPTDGNFNLVEMSLDTMRIERPYRSSSDGGSSSSNNNNNNNNNNNA